MWRAFDWIILCKTQKLRNNFKKYIFRAGPGGRAVFFKEKPVHIVALICR